MELYSGKTVFEDLSFEASGSISGNVREAPPDYATQIFVLPEELSWDAALETLKSGAFRMKTAAIGDVNSDRCFEIEYLAPGDYTLLVRQWPRGAQSESEYIDMASLRVNEGETTTIYFAEP